MIQVETPQAAMVVNLCLCMLFRSRALPEVPQIDSIADFSYFLCNEVELMNESIFNHLLMEKFSSTEENE